MLLVVFVKEQFYNTGCTTSLFIPYTRNNHNSNHYLVELFGKFNDEIRSYFRGVDATGTELADDQGRKLKDQVDEFIHAFYSTDVDGLIDVSEGTLKSVLERLMLSIENNRNPGLGTLNRLFMAVELVHLSKSEWSGLRTALIEELEAHLHPQAQIRVIGELQRRDNIQLILGKCQDIVYRNKCQDIVDSLSGLRLCCLLWDVVSTQLVFKFIHLTLLMEQFECLLCHVNGGHHILVLKRGGNREALAEYIELAVTAD